MKNKLQLPEEFVVQFEVVAYPLEGHGVLECIPPGAIILASCRSIHEHMIEVVWQEKRYVVFERDLQDRMRPLVEPEPEDDPPRWGDDRPLA